MKWLALIFVTAFAAQAAERHAPDAALPDILDAYARAAELPPLKDGGVEQLRIWTHDYMGGYVEGFAISSRGAIKCETRYHYAQDVVTIDRARCGELANWKRRSAALDLLPALAALDGKQWDCPLLDGGGSYIDGVHDGKRFALRVGNSHFCDDADSRRVAELLDTLPRPRF